jgi:hypothetical protein
MKTLKESNVEDAALDWLRGLVIAPGELRVPAAAGKIAG